MPARRPRLLDALALALAACSLTACASDPGSDLHTRGWVGGSFLEVAAASSWDASYVPFQRDTVLHGMPPAVLEMAGLAVADVRPGTPAESAGLRRGDLILRLGGRPVGDPDDFRSAIEDLAPGTETALGVWRDGLQEEIPLRIGTETYRRQLRLSLGLSMAPRIDLWPFDDGIDVLGLVTIGYDGSRYETRNAAMDYFRAAFPADETRTPSQEEWTFTVIPLGIGVAKRVVSQER